MTGLKQVFNSFCQYYW